MPDGKNINSHNFIEDKYRIDKSGKEIEKRRKNKLGNYQEAGQIRGSNYESMSWA